MILAPTLTLSVFAMFSAQPRLSERALGDIAVIGIPRMVKEEMYKGARDQAGRLTFTFATSYFWASLGSGTAYKHQLFVSLMASDATDGEYKEMPRNMSLSYDRRTELQRSAIASGNLTVYQGVYTQNTLAEPAHVFVYTDKLRRLQIVWHAVTKEISLADAVKAIERMASSFRIVREPTAEFAEMRDMPRKAESERARKRALIRETLTRAGYGTLEPGKPVFRDGVYLEWMNDPEPRLQMLVPLGRARVAANATPVNRPRPVRRPPSGQLGSRWAGDLGWREFADGAWTTSNLENAYLPFVGIAAELAKGEHDPAFVEFYYAATIRVEEVVNDRFLDNLEWLLDDLPDVRRLWREGKLVTNGVPASN
jgi:hypothetical protein